MRRRRFLLFLGGLLAAIILAFFLQDVIHQVVITPLAYLWWTVKLVYQFIPEMVIWIVLLAVLILSLLTSLLSEYPAERKFEKAKRKTQGAVETLAGWIKNSREGNYYKWLIANRLGKLADEMHVRMGRVRLPAHQEERETPGRVPSEAVLRYLKAGLEESFADYPLPPVPFLPRKATPFDLDVDEAVEFLETQMEASSGKKRS